MAKKRTSIFHITTGAAEALGITAPNDGIFDQHNPEIIAEEFDPARGRKYRLYDQHKAPFVIRNNRAVAPNNFVRQNVKVDKAAGKTTYTYTDDTLENATCWHYRHIPEMIATLMNYKADMDLEMFMLRRTGHKGSVLKIK